MKSFITKAFHTATSNQNIMSLSANVVVAVMSIISVSILFRFLAVGEVGVWIFFISTITLVDTFRSGFISTAFIKFYSGANPDRAAEVAGSTWVLASAITAFFILLNILAFLIPFPVSNVAFALFLKWFGFTFLVTLPSFIAGIVLQAEFRFDKILYIRLLNQGSFILFLLLLIFFGSISLSGIFYCYLISAGFTSMCCLLCGWTRMEMIRRYSRKCLMEIYHFGKFSVGTNIGTNLFFHSDTFIINFALGPASLAIYNLAKRFMEIVEMPLRSFVATAMAGLSAAYNQGKYEEVNKILKKYSGILTLCLAPAILLTIFFAEIPILLIGGDKYLETESANLLRVLMILSILSPIDRFIAVTTDVINRPKINLIKVLYMLVFNVAGNLTGIFLLGNLYGVAFASIPTTLFGFIYGFYLFNKFFPIPVSVTEIIRCGYREGKLLLKHFLLRSRNSLSPASRN